MLWRIKGRIFEWRQKHGDADPLVFLLVFLLCIAVPAMLIALRDDASRDTRQAGDRNEARDSAPQVPGRQTLPDPNAPVRRGADGFVTPARALTPTGGDTGQGPTGDVSEPTGGGTEPTGGGTQPVSDEAPALTPRRRVSEPDPRDPTPTVPTETEAAPAPAPQVAPAPTSEPPIEQPVEPVERPDREDRGGPERPDKEKKSPDAPVEEAD